MQKNRQSIYQIKAEKISMQIKNEVMREERRKEVKEFKDTRIMRQIMKEDLQQTLEEEIRMH